MCTIHSRIDIDVRTKSSFNLTDVIKKYGYLWKEWIKRLFPSLEQNNWILVYQIDSATHLLLELEFNYLSKA